MNPSPMVAPELTADCTAPSGFEEGCRGDVAAGWSFCELLRCDGRAASS